MTENRIEWQRPNKQSIWMMMACVNACLSPDAQTQCGCIITTKDHHVLGTGYNGYPRKCHHESLPNVRPDKYPWMQHSEYNALRNCTQIPKYVGGGIAYVTGSCCFPCTKDLWDSGVDVIYELEGFSNPKMVDDEHCRLKQELRDNLRREVHKKAFEKAVQNELQGRYSYVPPEEIFQSPLEIITVTPESIGPIFHMEQMNKIVELFMESGFDYRCLAVSAVKKDAQNLVDIVA